jgi:hypothetical protein
LVLTKKIKEFKRLSYKSENPQPRKKIRGTSNPLAFPKRATLVKRAKRVRPLKTSLGQ